MRAVSRAGQGGAGERAGMQEKELQYHSLQLALIQISDGYERGRRPSEFSLNMRIFSS